jgi:hypothetical protein
MEREMAENSTEKQNVISEQTGEFDARFVLWRTFCAEHNIPVETLPGDLEDDIKEEWEELKQEKLL